MWVKRMQAYEGYFENGQFHTAGRIIHIPERRRAIVNILDEVITAETLAQKQSAALERFIAENKALDEQGIEPLDDEFFAIINSGVGIDSGVDL